MARYQKIINQIYEENLGQIYENVDLRNYSTIRTGGIGRLLIEIDTTSQLQSVIGLLKEENFNYKVIGRGSNILFTDGILQTILIKLGEEFDEMEYSDNIISVGSRYSLRKLSKQVSKKGLAGLEFAGGIPATVGGAVCMNAGAHSGEMSEVVKNVTVLNKKTNSIQILQNSECQFRYRHSIFQEDNYIILKVELLLTKMDSAKVFKRMSGNLAYREEMQPLNFPSFGSTFRNPEDNHAGRLIEDANLKGVSIGGAQISDKHANFIINTGHAKTEDILALIKLIQDTIYQEKQITMRTEVEIIGEINE